MLRYLLLLFSVALALPAHAVDCSKLSPPVEVRAIWINTEKIPKTEREVRELVRIYHKANFNLLLPEVVAKGYTVYPSKLLARDPRFVGAVDPLAVMIDEAHKLGMEVHAWVWCFRAGSTQDRGAILKAHPDWVELNKDGVDASAEGGLWISPAIPAVRDFLANVYRELATKYDIDGLHLDYIRYEMSQPAGYGYCKYSCDAFRDLYGVDPKDINRLTYDQYNWNLFRERQINTFVHRISDEMRSIKPKLMISAAVGSDVKASRLNLMQNWANWVDNKWVDFLTPMAYTDQDGYFASQVRTEKEAVGTKTVLVPGIGLHMQMKAPDQTVRQIGMARELQTLGQAHFAAHYYTDGLAQALIAGPYAHPAELPFRNPRARCKELAAFAEKLALQSDKVQADCLKNMANYVSEYAKYISADTPYVPPTLPPFYVPETIVPLPTIDAKKIAEPIKIDGVLDDPGWSKAERVQLLYDNLGNNAAVATTAMVSYDDKCLYIAFQCSEPLMGKMKASVDQRDGPTFYDDSVELFIDPSAKRQEYYHLSANTLGTRFDQKGFNAAWNGDWNAVAKRTENGWTMELAIPFAGLGVSVPRSGIEWALNLTRNRTTSGTMEYLTWAVPYGSFHSPDRFGTIKFE